MATLYYPDGTTKQVKPRNGKSFQVEELQEMVKGYFRPLYLDKGEMAIVNEDGQALKLPLNVLASKRANEILVGVVLVCKKNFK